MAYELPLKQSFRNQLRALPKEQRAQILDKMDVLYDDPAPDGHLKKIHQYKQEAIFRLRSGDYRILPYFQIESAPVPPRYCGLLSRVALVERLREVLALVGFTRIASLNDFGSAEEAGELAFAPLSRHPSRWTPAAETHGEGIFLQFDEGAVQHWLHAIPGVERRRQEFRLAHHRWCEQRHVDPQRIRFPDARYILLHTFAHALMRQLSLACGYTAASLSERIYSLPPEHEDSPMAGVLIYTAAPDSEGTLGGWCAWGNLSTSRAISMPPSNGCSGAHQTPSAPSTRRSRRWWYCTRRLVMPVSLCRKRPASGATNTWTARSWYPPSNTPIWRSFHPCPADCSSGGRLKMTEPVHKVRAPWFPRYSEVRQLLTVLEGISKTTIRSMIVTIGEQMGTPQQPVDWSDPATWIEQRLAGEQAHLAQRIWEQSQHQVNPRYIDGSFLFINAKQLFAWSAAVCQLTEQGKAFLANDPGVIRQFDDEEGVLDLLGILATKKRAMRGDLLPE